MSRMHMAANEITVTRYVDEVCDRCHGNGEIAYGSTSTWHGGIGGCAITNDVCDRCWGSGDTANPWTNLREMKAKQSALVHEQAQRLLEGAMGARIGILQGAQAEIVEHLEALCRKRKHKHLSTVDLAQSLINTLRKMSEEGRAYGSL